MLSRSGITEGTTVPGRMPGELMRAEMAEQPQVLRALIARGGPRLGPYAGVVIVARGSPHPAANYGRYPPEVGPGRPGARGDLRPLPARAGHGAPGRARGAEPVHPLRRAHRRRRLARRGRQPVR